MGWSIVLIGLIMASSVVNSGGAGRIDRANQGPRYADSGGLPQNPDVAYRLALIDGSDAILREVLHRFSDHPRAQEVLARPRALSPGGAASMPSGPDAGTKITEGYARLVARDAYF